MSARAYLPADYSNAVVDAFEDLRALVLKREAQCLIAWADAYEAERTTEALQALSARNALRAVLDDIAVAIAKEQGR